jgi:hypothetical protein
LPKIGCGSHRNKPIIYLKKHHMAVTLTLVNSNTNLTETYFQVTTWWDGTVLTTVNEGTYLGALYIKDTNASSPTFNLYFRLAYTGPIPFSRWTITQAILIKLLADLGGSGGTIYVDQQVSITSSLVIPSTVTLQFPNDGSLNQPGFNITANMTLTIPPAIIAGNYQIFYGTGKVTCAQPYTANLYWFGVTGKPWVSPTVNDTAAFQRYVNYCAASKSLVFIRDGRYEVTTIDFTGCNRVMGETISTTIAGRPGLDVCYWKATGEAGYLALKDIEFKSLRLIVDNTAAMSPQPLRVGFGGELVTNCAIYMPGAFTYNFDQVFVTTPAAGTFPGSCAFFSDGQAYKVNFGTKCEFRAIDYGVIVGSSEKNATIQPKPVTSFNAATGVFTMNNSYAANYQMALIWDNTLGDLTGIMPRERYYIVNPTATTFQISATSGGAPITFTSTATPPQLYVIQAGSSSIEFACDEWAALHLITATNKCGFSAPNLEQCHFGTFGCQSTKVAIRLLNYHSLTRLASNNVSFREIYTEGPQDAVNMVNKEYMRFEGEFIVVGVALRVYNSAMINIYAHKSNFNGFVFNNATTLINIYGNNNILTNVGSYNKDGSVNNQGSGNRISYSKSPSGTDNPKYQNILSNKTFSRELGGFFPDYLLTGNPNTPYFSENVLFHPAESASFYTPTTPPVTYMYDTPPDGLNGYVRSATVGVQIGIKNPLGSTTNPFQVDQYFPKGKWRLYAMVRTLTVTQNVTLTVAMNIGTGPGPFSRVTSVLSGAPNMPWTLISVDCDHSTAAALSTIKISVTSSTEGLDLAYFVVAPWPQSGPSATASLDFPPTAAGTSADLTVTVPGAAAGDSVSLGIPAASITAMGSYIAWVSAVDTVTIRFMNLGAASQDPAAGTFKVSITK